MNRLGSSQLLSCLAVVLAVTVTCLRLESAEQPKLEPKPVGLDPEPVGKLHPNLRWMKERKIRGIWIEQSLLDKYPGLPATDKTNGRILVDAGFNLVVMQKPVSQISEQAEEGRRLGICVMILCQYGSGHDGAYRRYREGSGRMHKTSCCPLQLDYLERHIFKYLVQAAESGAHGVMIDA